MPALRVCDFTHYYTVLYNVWQCSAERARERKGERRDKKERPPTQADMRLLDAPLVPQSQLLGSDGCLALLFDVLSSIALHLCLRLPGLSFAGPQAG